MIYIIIFAFKNKCTFSDTANKKTIQLYKTPAVTEGKTDLTTSIYDLLVMQSNLFKSKIYKRRRRKIVSWYFKIFMCSGCKAVWPNLSTRWIGHLGRTNSSAVAAHRRFKQFVMYLHIISHLSVFHWYMSSEMTDVATHVSKAYYSCALKVF